MGTAGFNASGKEDRENFSVWFSNRWFRWLIIHTRRVCTLTVTRSRLRTSRAVLHCAKLERSQRWNDPKPTRSILVELPCWLHSYCVLIRWCSYGQEARLRYEPTPDLAQMRVWPASIWGLMDAPLTEYVIFSWWWMQPREIHRKGLHCWWHSSRN